MIGCTASAGTTLSAAGWTSTVKRWLWISTPVPSSHGLVPPLPPSLSPRSTGFTVLRASSITPLWARSARKAVGPDDGSIPLLGSSTLMFGARGRAVALSGVPAHHHHGNEP